MSLEILDEMNEMDDIFTYVILHTKLTYTL